MPKYLFTSDQRISALPERIQWVAKFIHSGHNVSEIADKSDNNNAATLKFYYNLHSGTETCEKAVENPVFVIRNFVLKFQFPNVRTQESLQNTISERLLLAPYRSVVSLLVALAEITKCNTSAMSMSEILYYVFCNPTIYDNPAVNYKEVAKQILDSRGKNEDFENVVGNLLEWNQYGRQSRELINVLTYSSKCFSFSKGILKYSTTHEDYIIDKDFIDELITYNKFWYPTDSQDFNLATLEYISYMNTVNTPYSVVEFSPNTVEPKKDVEHKNHQQIFYGAPGTGKSHRIKEQLEALNVPKENVFRTTFHPDSDFSTFVGAYKPTMKKQYRYDGKVKAKYYEDDDLAGAKKDDVIIDKVIQYDFVPQTFIKAYVRAYQTDENVYLIIEEINRGNCAQIFGDLFQLLDRDENGASEYTIKADADIRAYLEDVLGCDSNGIKDGELCLPSNLYIYATMNTSDQSLFPIDSAFKRRWDWEYEPIKYKNTDWLIDINGNMYLWTSFQKEVNNRIFESTNSEDKMLGDFFVKPNDGIITEKLLLNKVLFYLWNDVCKDGDGDIFKTEDNTDVKFSDLYGENGTAMLLSMMKHLKVELVSASDDDIEDDDNDGDNTNTKRYSINGEETNEKGKQWGKGTLVKRAVEIYCNNHPQDTATQIRDAWMSVGFKISHIVETEGDKRQRLTGSRDKTGRERAKEVKLSNGESIYVSTEVGSDKIYDAFGDFLSKIQSKPEWGINIQEL